MFVRATTHYVGGNHYSFFVSNHYGNRSALFVGNHSGNHSGLAQVMLRTVIILVVFAGNHSASFFWFLCW